MTEIEVQYTDGSSKEVSIEPVSGIAALAYIVSAPEEDSINTLEDGEHYAEWCENFIVDCTDINTREELRDIETKYILKLLRICSEELAMSVQDVENGDYIRMSGGVDLDDMV